MAKLQVRRTKAAGVKPTPAQIMEGELIVNLADKKLYTKNDSGAVIQIGNPEQADKLDIATSLTVGGGASIQNGAIVAKSLDVTGKDAVINIGSGDTALPVVNFNVNPNKTHSIKATDTDLELRADRVDIMGGKLSLNPLGAGEIQGKGSNKIMSDDGAGNVTLSGSRDGTTPGLLILGGKTQGHNTQAVKLSSDLVNSAGDILVNATTGKIRTSMLDTVFTTPNDVAGNYYNKGESDAKYQTIANTTANFYNRTQIATVLNDYYTKTGATGVFQTKADAIRDHYSKVEADSMFFNKSQSDARYFGTANNVLTDGTIQCKSVNGLTDGSNTSMAYSGFYRMNQGIGALGGLNIHVAHPDRGDAAHARGIAFQYGGSGNQISTYRYDATGAFVKAAKIYTEDDKPTAAELSVLPLTGGTLTGNVTATALLISGTQNTSANAATRKDYVDGHITTVTALAQTATNSANAKLPLTGGTLTGNLRLSHDNASVVVGNNGDIGFIKKTGANGCIGIGSGTTFRISRSNQVSNIGVSDTFTDAFVISPTATTISTSLTTTGEIRSNSANGFRIAYGSYGFFIRNDSNNTYFMLTASGDAGGGYNALRPITISNTTGAVSMGNGLTVWGGLNVSSGNVTTAGALTTAGSITCNGADTQVNKIGVSAAAGSWISMRDQNVLYNRNVCSTASAQAILRQEHVDHHFYVGGLGNSYFGFFRTAKNRTDNGVDGQAYLHVDGRWITPGGINTGALVGTSGAFSGAVTAGNITSSGSSFMMQSNQRRHIAFHNGTQYDGYIYKDSNGSWQFNNGANTGTWSMDTTGRFTSNGGVHVGGALVGATTGDFSGKLTVNANSDAVVLNASTSTNAVYYMGKRAGVNGFYLGFGGSDNVAVFHNYLHNTTIQLRAADVYASRDLYGAGTGNFTDVYIRSDKRLKTNLVKVESAINKVEKLTAYHYDKRATLESDDYDKKEVGLIAQELQKVLPEAVTEQNGLLSISNSAVNALLVEAVKELTERVKELEAK